MTKKKERRKLCGVRLVRGEVSGAARSDRAPIGWVEIEPDGRRKKILTLLDAGLAVGRFRWIFEHAKSGARCYTYEVYVAEGWECTGVVVHAEDAWEKGLLTRAELEEARGAVTFAPYDSTQALPGWVVVDGPIPAHMPRLRSYSDRELRHVYTSRELPKPWFLHAVLVPARELFDRGMISREWYEHAIGRGGCWLFAKADREAGLKW